MARKVERKDIVDYQTWIERRDAEREKMMKVKEPRRVHVGEHLTFLFENTDTVRYQIQEMMRAEEIVKEEAIQHEIDTYNELLGRPDEIGCVLLIEVETAEERAVKLVEWLDLPKHIYAELEDGTKVRPKYDERQVGETRVSSVQYMTFDTDGKVPVALGSDLPALEVRVELTDEQRRAIEEDLKDGAVA